jgi:hypothetical protein
MNEISSEQLNKFSEIFQESDLILKFGFKKNGPWQCIESKVIQSFYQYLYDSNGSRHLYVFLHPQNSGIDISISICRDIDEDNIYDEAENSFALSRWLEKHGYKFDSDPFRLNYNTGSLEDQIGKFSHFINEICKNEDLQKILRGETWEHIPSDWMGFK